MKERTHEYRGDDGTPRFHREKESRVMKTPRLEPLNPAAHPEIAAIHKAASKVALWENGAYYGVVAWYQSGSALGDGPYAVLSISSCDESARHDWRDFQQLKDLLVGEDWEGVELYPARSRLVDPSNRFYLWCFPQGRVGWGFTHRHVLDMEEAPAPQRPFPERK